MNEDIDYSENRQKCKRLIEKYWVDIKGGYFEMGTPDHSKYCFIGERPLHTVFVDDFKISSITITEEMYNLYDPNYEVKNCRFPATNITWNDANGFCRWLGYYLPTEAEWEYSCRAHSKDNWFCDELELHNYCWFSTNSKSNLHEVAELKPNAFGLFDMLGNVWEWCSDFYSKSFYFEKNTINPLCMEDNCMKVCRGGSYYSFTEMCRSNFRWKEPIDFKAKDLGFRIVNRLNKNETV